MIFYVLACDYDGTLAHHGQLSETTVAALERVKRSGRKLMMVTGRELPDLKNVCHRLDLFDAVVAENGALLYLPATREERLLCEPANEDLINELKKQGVPVSVGQGIIATWEPHQNTVLEAIQHLGLEYSVIFNKGAVMILPTNVNKGSGLDAGLLELGYSRHNAVAIGDAENDHIFLSRSECAVAVANALPSLKERADYVTKAPHGDGIAEFIDEHLLNDLVELAPQLAKRHHIVLGKAGDMEIAVPAQRAALLVTGGSGSGKSTLTGVLIEHLVDDGRNVCVIDPEGDYATLVELGNVLVLGGGNDKPLPSPDELAQIVSMPKTDLVLNLHALSLAEKSDYVATALSTLEQVRLQCGRPHWLIIDEAHHVLPKEGSAVADLLANSSESLSDSLCLITFDTSLLAESALKLVKTIAARTTDELHQAIEAVIAARALDPSVAAAINLDGLKISHEEAAIVSLDDKQIEVKTFAVDERRSTHRRHIRKYANGELPIERSFYFRGAQGKLKLRAANLIRFGELAEGVDDDTWLFHLKNGDYSQWIRENIKNDDLAGIIASIENNARKKNLSAQETRNSVLEAINERYAA